MRRNALVVHRAHDPRMTTPWFGLHLPLYTFPDAPTVQIFDRVAEQARAAEDAGFTLVTPPDATSMIRADTGSYAARGAIVPFATRIFCRLG